MKKMYSFAFFILTAVMSATVLLPVGCTQKINPVNQAEREDPDKYDGPDKAAEFEWERTRDLTTGKIPMDKLLSAINETQALKAQNQSNMSAALSWIERGPDGDFSGPQGNSRPNNDQTAGRIRAAMIDSSDVTHKTVWVGGVDGGLWKTTDITANPATWVLINDYMSNLAISAICQDPRPGFNNIMYVCTGESFRNADGVRGVGVFKSIDGGATWNYLASTSSYILCSRILCDFQGNVYLATRNTGLLRSTDGGTSWTVITPAGIGSSICDLEISSTSAPARLHMVTGIGTAQNYRYTDIPTTVTSASGWNAPATPFPSFNERAEICVSGNVLYALPVNNATNQVPIIYRSADGGANWVATATQPGGGTWASGQGWYSLSCRINPADPNQCIIGGLDCYKTTDGGGTWTKISTWAASSGQYVHADQHNIMWWDGGTKLMFTCDGGVHYSSDGGTTIRDRNKGLRLKQFYSIAIHPTAPNFFIAGAQDNGVHRLNHPGLDSSIEVYGGDGCYVAIDQNEGQYQFGSYVYNVYRRSVNNGNSWTTPVNLGTSGSNGRFVNPWDYDNNTNIVYACYTANNYLRWDNPQTGGTTTIVPMATFGGGNISAVHASPYTANTVYFGMGTGNIVRVDNANGAAPTGTLINSGAGMPAGYVNSIVTGSNDQNMIATFTNYGVQNVWVTTNAGTSWTAIDGNLPDMPVRWALFHPDANTKAFIATETGVWETDLINGASTVWTPSTSFPTVRTDMIKYRASDRTIAAGTHGRGVWSATVPSPGCTAATVNNQPSNATVCPGNNASFSVAAAGTGPLTYQWQVSTTGCAGAFVNVNNTGVYTGATTTTLDITGATAGMNGYAYRVAITGNCAPLTVNSSCVSLTVNAATNISSQPTNSTLCSGANTSFSVAATGSSLSYQWQVSTDGGGTFNDITNGGVYTGATSNTLNITAAPVSMNTYQYRCVINSTCAALATTTVAILNVNTPVTITTQPVNKTLCASGTTSFSIAATGTAPSYQWQLSTDGGTTWTNISNGGVYSGASTSTLALTGVIANMNGYKYRNLVTGAAPCGAVNSSVITLTVSPQPTITLTASPYTKLLPGYTTTITASSSIMPAGNVIYTWYFNNTVIPGVNGTTYLVDVNYLGDYKVTVTDISNNCTNTSAILTIADSASNKLFIWPSPTFDGKFTVSYYNPGGGATTQDISIYNRLGERVYVNKDFPVSQAYQLLKVDMRRNAAGLYYVVLRLKDGTKKTGTVVIR